jgi:septum formation protein
MDNHQRPQAEAADSQVEDVFGNNLVLASASPRRSEILTAVKWPFQLLPVDIDESRRPGEEPVEYVERLALEKASAAAERIGTGLILGADTTVLVEGDVLGKPRDEDEAQRMLRRLSGRWHDVLTGVALVRAGAVPSSRVAHERTGVRFVEMSDAEIDWHVQHGAPLDKAGAYAVQGLAALFIAEVRGDYWNVVGLPVQLVYRLARDIRLASVQ